MLASRILLLLAIFMPALFALAGGRGFAWQFLSLVCSALTLGSLALVALAAPFWTPTGLALALLFWLAAWVFGGLAASLRRRERLAEQLLEQSQPAVDDAALRRNLRRRAR